jgi:hypothetical protein
MDALAFQEKLKYWPASSGQGLQTILANHAVLWYRLSERTLPGVRILHPAAATEFPQTSMHRYNDAGLCYDPAVYALKWMGRGYARTHREVLRALTATMAALTHYREI